MDARAGFESRSTGYDRAARSRGAIFWHGAHCEIAAGRAGTNTIRTKIGAIALTAAGREREGSVRDFR